MREARRRASATFTRLLVILGLSACTGAEDLRAARAVRTAVEGDLQGGAVAVLPIRADSALALTITGFGYAPSDTTALDSIAVRVACVALETPESQGFNEIRVVVWATDAPGLGPQVPTAMRLARGEIPDRCTAPSRGNP